MHCAVASIASESWHAAELARAREPALILAGGSTAVTMLDAFIVHPAFANAVRDRDRREISGRREGCSEQDQQQCRNGGLTHPIHSRSIAALIPLGHRLVENS